MKVFSSCLAALSVVLGVAWYAGYLGNFEVTEGIEAAVSYIEAQGENAILTYICFSAAGTVLLVPTTVMEFAGGFLFSGKYGMLSTWGFTCFAKLIGNLISLFLARNFFREFIRTNIVEKWELLRMVADAAAEEPFKVAFLVRGSMAPVSVKNYGLGVLDLGYLPILAASCVFTPFYAYQNVYLGSACQDLKEVFSPRKKAADGSSGGDWFSTFKTVFPMVFNVVLVLFLVRAVKIQIKKQRDKVEASMVNKQQKAAKAE
mmetsp:Transcript_82000/g.171634  ORF Transcript_82000/g.171634 Transcript_82000/m.171634 type:complete len:260 (-) Transcript_82000:198-977(-)|eukprot:CAMPEP_0206476588 /NCGR_PEP_ID=MMETSP0324_2-20121206/34821_1 /ASSEMBLY_ACC=CAM_ASM_000836 /TAXON_ID=2866 /ORGANISM="Crypthecodinium cohnii, Strain Seligo" /LENGTH=259 /DNA_ID=CAMNT_0053952279 /DNA_START=104 /DNA_END=883 /DNA_ORIENTATION=-